MRRFNCYCVMVVLLVVSIGLQAANYVASPKYEMRSVWLTTHYRIDWPSTKVKSSTDTKGQAAQQKELTNILDKLKENNLNSFCLQVRPTADAFYKSSYEPWSANLSDVRGLDPGYDPLQFAIEEGHKRGLEVHVWVNPFRYEVYTGSYGNDDPLRKNHPDWLIAYKNGSYNGTIIDPGIPEAREYVIDVLMEIVNNYDIEGILMDDYFYPYGGTTTEDAASKAKYMPTDMDETLWRIDNVNKTMEMLYDSIQQVKPWVRFGMAPFGIWTTQSEVASRYGLTLPKGITGLDDYQVQFCNPIDWVIGGYVDYLAPQLYWATTSSGQNYDVLSSWWATTVKTLSDKLVNKRVHFYVSHAAYRDFSAAEMRAEIDDNRKVCPYDAPGSIYYNTHSYLNTYAADIKQTHYASKALMPVIDWKKAEAMAAPTNIVLNQNTLSWEHPTAERFTIYAYPKGRALSDVVSTNKYLYDVVWGNKFDVSKIANYEDLTIAVRAYDFYGNESEAVLWNEYTGPIIAVTSVSIKEDSAVINRGQSIELHAEVQPLDATNKDIYWSVSDANILSVEEGVVTGVGKGTANVIVTTDDGEFVAQCPIRVRVGVEQVSINKRSLTLNIGDAGFLVATIKPNDAENKEVIWTTDDERVVTVEDGFVTAVGAGEANVIATAVDGGLTAQCHIVVNGSTGIDETVANVYIAVTENGLLIESSVESHIQVYTASGVLVTSSTARSIAPSLPHGAYIVIVNGKPYKIFR